MDNNNQTRRGMSLGAVAGKQDDSSHSGQIGCYFKTDKQMLHLTQEIKLPAGPDYTKMIGHSPTSQNEKSPVLSKEMIQAIQM